MREDFQLNKRTVRDVEWANKRALVRVDFNVPRLDDGTITDDTRIRAALPTITYLCERGAKVVLMSHLGRPKGARQDKYSLQGVATHLAKLLPRVSVKFAADCIGSAAETVAAGLRAGEVVLLENVRFYKEEEENDAVFAQKLARLGNVFVNDAFGTAHRAHASTAGVASSLPTVAGLLLEKEVSVMGAALEHPAHPFVAVIGGAKVSDKIRVIENLLKKVDHLLIGGGMANTFLAVQGVAMGKSLVEADALDTAKALLEQARGQKCQLHLPVDVVAAKAFAADAAHRICRVQALAADEMALDIGPETIANYQLIVRSAQTVIWNGPMGVFEMPAFAKGTIGVALALADVDGVTIVGGGDSVAAIEQAHLADKMTHVSTGGGATLEFLEGQVLPGVDVIENLAR